MKNERQCRQSLGGDMGGKLLWVCASVTEFIDDEFAFLQLGYYDYVIKLPFLGAFSFARLVYGVMLHVFGSCKLLERVHEFGHPPSSAIQNVLHGARHGGIDPRD